MMRKTNRRPLSQVFAAYLPLALTAVLTALPFPHVAVTDAHAADTPDAKLVEGNNTFAFDLLRELSTNQSGNIFFSPYSISSALGMTAVGAKGDTLAQMLNVFHWREVDSLPKSMHGLSESLAAAANMPPGSAEIGKPPKLKLAIANSLWTQADYTLLPDFVTTVRENFDAELRPVDFKGQTEAARVEINQWVEAKTNDKIKNLIQSGVLKADTRLVLVNAVYFLATWAEQFKSGASKPGEFKVGAGKTANATFMNQTHSFNYAENTQLQLVELPYEGGRLAMTVVLPKSTDAGAVDSLTAKAVFAAIESAEFRSVQLTLPKFKLESSFSLQQALTALGMRDAFAPDRADFSPMNGNRDFFIGSVIHKAFIDVDENGTEAAAATAVIMRTTSAMMPQSPVVFRADHPFLFLIRDTTDGTILFAGRMSDPA